MAKWLSNTQVPNVRLAKGGTTLYSNRIGLARALRVLETAGGMVKMSVAENPELRGFVRRKSRESDGHQFWVHIGTESLMDCDTIPVALDELYRELCHSAGIEDPGPDPSRWKPKKKC